MALTLRGLGDWPAILLLVIGAVGGKLESSRQWNYLVETVPFKVYDTDHYRDIADLVDGYGPWLSLAISAAALVLLPRFKSLAGLLPVIIVPLLYILQVHLGGVPLEFRLDDDNGMTSVAHHIFNEHDVFYKETINWMLFGIGCYLVAFVVVRLIARSMQTSTDSRTT